MPSGHTFPQLVGSVPDVDAVLVVVVLSADVVNEPDVLPEDTACVVEVPALDARLDVEVVGLG